MTSPAPFVASAPDRQSLPASGRGSLPASGRGFALGDGEPLASGLRRVTVEQFDSAISELVSGADVDEAIHDTRKVVKRLRAILRLVRTELGDDVYRFENGYLRDTAALIGAPRDAWVAVETVRAVRDEFAEHLDPAAFGGLEAELVSRYGETRAHVVGDAGLLSEVVYRLRSAKARYAAWPTDDDAARAYGRRVIRHSFSSLEDGLGTTYATGRAAMASAMKEPRAETFHEWRKHAKYLRHQMEILTPLWPDVLAGYARAADRLGEALGAEHDLAVLLDLVATDPGIDLRPGERSLLVALAQYRRSELQRAAITLGARVYAEPEKDFIRRIGSYWHAWDALSLR